MHLAKRKLPARGGQRATHEAEAGLSGALAGAAMGAFAGPPGAVAGAVIGGVAGVLAGVAMDNAEEDRSARDTELDLEIGVAGGDLGAPNLEHPPATTGTYSAAVTGTDGAQDDAPAEGPMQIPDP
jgi:phage tail tape-measure protein